MEKLKEELWNTLQELKEEEFTKFKWFLNVLGHIPKAHLEKAERHDTVDQIVQKYQGPEALTTTLTVLKKISRNDLVLHLRNSSSGLRGLKNHHAVPLRSDYERQRAKLEDKMKLMIEERQMKIREIKHSAELSSKSADRHISDSEQVFAALMESIKTSLTHLIEAINEKRKTMHKQAKEFIQELEQEITELKKRSNMMEQLSRTEDDHKFFQSLTLNAIPTTKNWTEVTILAPYYERNVETVVNQIEEELTTRKKKLIAKTKLNTLKEFAKNVTLDPDTANPFLTLSDDGTQVYCGNVKRNLPDNPKRFNTASNVLGKQSFSSGRFYYEVQVKGKTSWDVGVVRESIDRKGSIKASPEKGYWTICLRNGDKYKAFAANLSVKYELKTVGVFVDYEEGSVSFYDVDSADLIHCFTNCSFTEKLNPFFSPGPHNGGKNSTPLIISPVNYTFD